MDVTTLGIVVAAVIATALVLYALDRKTRGEHFDLADAVKIASGAGIVTGGVVYAIGTDSISDIAETVTTATQEMLVGRPA